MSPLPRYAVVLNVPILFGEWGRIGSGGTIRARCLPQCRGGVGRHAGASASEGAAVV